MGGELLYIFASPFVSRKRLAEELDISTSTVDTIVKELKAEEGKRYKKDTTSIKTGSMIRINYLAFIDYFTYRDRLKEKNLRKGVPEYNPKHWAEQMGWYATKAV